MYADSDECDIEEILEHLAKHTPDPAPDQCCENELHEERCRDAGKDPAQEHGTESVYFREGSKEKVKYFCVTCSELDVQELDEWLADNDCWPRDEAGELVKPER